MKKFLLWFLAFVITAGSAVYQRMTGPTYELSGMVELDGREIKYDLPRTHEIGDDCLIRIETDLDSVTGVLLYKRHNTADRWAPVPMAKAEGALSGILPTQPAAGKLDYTITLTGTSGSVTIPQAEAVVIRFKGAVPLWVLLPHVLIMFLAMLFSTRAGIEALLPKGKPRKLVIWTTGLVIAGGMILGPLVQKFAFGEYWTGFPFGTDLTDNKTLIALIAWVIALIAGRKGKSARGWIIAASIIMLAVYLVPHSLLGSELDYSQMETPRTVASLHHIHQPL
jgi:hypothetical protein